MPATPITLNSPVGATGTTLVPQNVYARSLLGYSVAEVGGSGYGARVRIFDGSTAAANLLATVSLGTRESKSEFWVPAVVPITSGQVFVQAAPETTGPSSASAPAAVEGSVWWS